MKETKANYENGITLIALIITIIILVILAAVSIRAAYSSGIIDYSINGTQKYKEEANKEESILSETEGFMASILSRLRELDNDNLANNDNSENNENPGNNETPVNSDVPDLLRKYVLGANENGRDLYEILDYYMNSSETFKNDSNSITNASETVIFLNGLYEDLKDGTICENYLYIKYNNVAYKIEVDEDTTNSTYTTKDIEKVYEPNGTEGEIVEYSVDGTSPEIDWLVLYDNGETVDITPVTIDNNWKYKLGYSDSAAIAALPSGNNVERAIWSYNHAADTLNLYCGTIVTNGSAQNVRSIGTSFETTDANKLVNTNNLYSSTFLANNPTGQADEGNYNGVGLKGDIESEQDIIRISYYSTGNSYVPFGYANMGVYYWLASRVVYEYPIYMSGYMREVRNTRSSSKHKTFMGS